MITMKPGLFEKDISRRDFLRHSCIFALGLGLSPVIINSLLKPKAYAAIGDTSALHEAMHYQRVDEKTVQCLLCPRKCTLGDGQRSFCRVREPKKGKLYTLVYGKPCAVHIDPIEKKPIYHMLPGSQAFSIATAGCNLRCKFCQNWQISQRPPEETTNISLPPKEVVRLAAEKWCQTIAYTYSEPTVFYEYMIDTARLAKEKGIGGIYVSGGYVNPEPLGELCKYIDCANIDLKGYSDKYLRETCAEELKPLLTTLKVLKKRGIWVEITNLVIPTLNDDMKMIGQMCAWIKDNLGEDTPLHFSRFTPRYKLRNLSPTPVPILEEAREVALKAGLDYVYIGNVPGHEANHTYCPSDKKVLIRRAGYRILENNIVDGKCKFCGNKISGIWS